MKKKYLMNAVAVLALGLTAASCSKDLDISKADIVGNAESALGVKIAPDHDWIMTQNVTATISVNLGLDQAYTVAVYNENPLFNENVNYFCKEAIADGGTLTLNLSLPVAQEVCYVAVYDSKFRGMVETATIDDGQLNVNFGSSATRGFTRAVESDYIGSYAKTAANYLDGLTETTMQGYAAFDNSTIDDYSGTLTNKKHGTVVGNYILTAGEVPTSRGLGDGGAAGTLTLDGFSTAAIANTTLSYNGWNAVAMGNKITIIPKFSGGMNVCVMSTNGHAFNVKEDGVNIFYTPWAADNYDRVMDNYISITAGKKYEFYCDGGQIGFLGCKMTFTNVESTLGDGRHFRVPANTTITKPFSVNGNDANYQPMMNGAVIYVQGKMNVSKDNTFNSATIVVANDGEVVLNGEVNMSNYGRFVVLPGGKITGTEGSSLKVNNGAKSYNAGTINFEGELNVNGSDFYNCGTINLASMRNTSGGKITNFGEITCGTNMNAADAYNSEMINGCYWHYTGDAGIGQLTMLKNSRLDVDGRAEFTQSWISGFDASNPKNCLTHNIPNPNILMDKSVVNVGTAYVTNTVFQGPSDNGEIAIVKMNKVMVGNGSDLMQRGNCYFDWDITELYNKEDKKYQDISASEKQYNKYGYLVDYYREHVTKFITEATSPVSIPEGTCTGAGYNPNGEGGSNLPGGPQVYTYAFEDTFMGDYDMNDVVLQVWEENGQLKIKLCATGASKDLYVYYDNNPLFQRAEVHQLFGAAAGKFVNTGASGAGDKFTTVASANWPVSEMSKPSGFDYATAGFNIRWGNLTRDESIWLTTRSDSPIGTAPYAVCIPDKWAWPTEWTKVSEAYPGNSTYPSFADYARDPSKSTWYKAPDVSKTISPE